MVFVMETPRLISQLSDLDILRLVSEASQGGDEFETARTLLRHEMARRGILDSLETTTGVVDALENTDGMIEPQHNDSRWVLGSMSEPDLIGPLNRWAEAGYPTPDETSIVRGED